jgi:hypothetical protein
MNMIDTIVNGSFILEEYVWESIIKPCVDKRIPILVFINVPNVKFVNRVISVITKISQEKFRSGNLSAEEWIHFDEEISKVYDAPLYVNDIEVKSIEDCKSSVNSDLILKEKIKYVLFDSLPENIDKLELIRWGEDLGTGVYFTRLTLG